MEINEVKEVNGIKFETCITISPITGWVTNIKTVVRTTGRDVYVDSHDFNGLSHFSKEIDDKKYDICFDKWTGEYTVTTLERSKHIINPETNDFAIVKKELFGEEKESILNA